LQTRATLSLEYSSFSLGLNSSEKILPTTVFWPTVISSFC